MTSKEDLERLEQIDNAKPSEALKCLVRIDKEYLTIESEDFDICYDTIKQALLKAQDNEKLKNDICEMFGLDNLFPYNDTKEILKELEEYMDRRNQLWVDFMKTSKKLKEQEKVLEILKKHPFLDLSMLYEYGIGESIEYEENESGTTNELTAKEFEELKDYFSQYHKKRLENEQTSTKD